MAYKTKYSKYNDEYVHRIGMQMFGEKDKLVKCLKFNFGYYPDNPLSVCVNEKYKLVSSESA